jgi:hypothetical protein
MKKPGLIDKIFILTEALICSGFIIPTSPLFHRIKKDHLIELNLLLKRGWIVLAFLICHSYAADGAPRTASVSGNWSNTATWGGASVPTSADDVTINSGITVTVDVVAAANTVTFAAVNANSSIVISGTNSLAVTGLITMPRPAAGITCTISVGAGTLTCGSLTMSATTTNRNDIISISSGNLSIGGAITTGTTGCQFTFTGAGTMNVGGAFSSTPALTTFTGSTVNYYGTNQTILPTTYSNLTLSGSGAKTTTGVTVNGVLSMEGDGTVSATAVPAYGGAATLQYKGIGSQTTGIEFPATFSGTGGLIINNPNGVSFTGSKTLSATGALTLTTGNIILGDYNITVTAPVAGAPFGITNMIVTNGSGALIKTGSTVASFQTTYPVGTTGNYSPMVISTLAATTGSGTISVRAVANRQANVPFANDALQKHWVVSTTGLTGITDARLTFYYNPGEVIGNSALYVPRVWNGVSLVAPAGATAAGADPFGVNAAGNNIISGEWTALDPSNRTPFYSYQNGNWNDYNTWTLDPSGTLFTNPSNLVPSASDKVKINTGHTVTISANGINVNLLNIEGTLDLGSTTGHTFTTLSGMGRIRISNADVFPASTTNTFFTSDQGTVEYYGNSFALSTGRNIYNLEINMSTGQTLTLMATPYNVAGNLTVKQGTFRINDNASTVQKILTILKDITVKSGAFFTVGQGNTLNGTIDETATGAMQFFLAHNSVNCYGDLTNNGTIRFTNQAAPVYNAFTSTGAVSLFMKGASDNTITCNGTTDLYNLVIDKGNDQSYKLTIYSSAIANFRLYGPDGLYDYATGGGFTQENPELRKPLWIKNGTLELTGSLFIPSLTESGGDYYIPANSLLWINGADVTVWNTDRTNPGASVGGIQGTGVDASNGGSQSFSVFGNLRVTKGFFSTKSHGIVLWYQPTVFGGILVEGGQCDINGIRTANGNTAGKFSFSQTGGLIRFLGDNGNENMENYASLCLRGTDCSFSMSGGTMEFYDGQTGANNAVTSTGGIIRIESSPSNIDVTGGTVKIIRNVAGGDNYTIYTSAPFYNLELSATITTTLTTNINSAITILNNLTINDYSTLDATTGNNNVSVGANFILGNTSGTNNAVYNARNNTTSFIGNLNSTITVANTANTAPLTFYNLTLNKTPTSSMSNAWTVTLNSPGRTETAGSANNHLLTISNDMLISEGKWNNYRYKTRVQRHITNYGTILSDAVNPGRITLENGGVVHQLTGSSSVVNSFGDLELNEASGAQIYSNISTGNFYLTSGILDINTFNLGVVTGITGNTYSTTKMIRSYGSPASQGVTLSLSVSGAYANQDIAVIPVGVGGTYTGDGTKASAKYTPLTINLNGNAGAGPFTGTINVRPVDEYHPTSDPTKLGDLIPFYWETSNTGNLSGVSVAIVTYSLYSSYAFDYTGGKKECYYRSTTWTEADAAANPLVFSGTGFIATDYTAGKKNSFRSPQYLYSRQSGNWNTLSTWSTSGHGTTNAPSVLNSFDVYEIGGSGGVNHQVTVTASNTVASRVIIQSITDTGIATDPPPSLIINSALTGNDFNLISGGGRLVLNDGTLPNGDYLDFCNNDIAIFEYAGGTYTLPSNLTVYPNLWISGNVNSNKTLPNTNILVRKNLNIYDRTNSGITLTLSSSANGNITVNDSLVLDNQSKLVFQNSGTARTVTVLKNINCVNGGSSEVNSIEVTTGGAANLTHQLVIQGDIRSGASTFNLYSPNSVVDLVLNGETNSRIYNYAGAGMSLNKLIVNKAATTLTATIDKAFSTGAVTNTAYKPLSLQQGVLRINNLSTNLVLSSGGGDYIIPETGSLILDQGSLSVSGNSTGITLNGLLGINGGSVTIYNAANTNNYIQYSSTGSARINITGGSLRVGSQIRRFTTTTAGVLTYRQTGGTVEVGYSDAPAVNRGVFEVLNTGSSFTLTGGTITIFRGQLGATFPSFYIDPAISNIGSGMAINLGGATGSPEIGIYSSVSLPNIVVSGTGTPTVRMWNIPLSIDNDLIINSGAVFDANGLQLNIKGNFSNSGTFTSHNNIVVFNGSSTQAITGVTTFYNLTKSTSNTLNVNSSIQINNNLRVENGSLNDNGNNIRVLRDVYNIGTITYGGSLNSSTQLGLHMNGSVSQAVTGTGTFGKITVDNTDGVYLSLGSTINISNALRLNQGLFDIQGNLLVLGANCAVEGSGFNAYKMIQTNISFTDNGIKKYFPSGAQNFTYPIGSNGKYTPLTFNITANASSTGSITLKAANEIHPGITDDTETTCQLNDLNNVLQYYWTVVSQGITGFSGTARFTGLVSDIKVNNTCSLTPANYITAKLLYGSTSWNKFTSDKFDETSCQLDFDFYSTDDNGISGDYLAGLDDAIPNSVTVYETINSGNWSNQAIWQTVPSGGPIPAGGPRGCVVIINPAHTVDVTTNGNIFNYKTTVNGTLNLNSTTQHRLGYASGTGILKMVDISTLPAGDYFGVNGFITSAGGTLEYAGTSNYSVLSTLPELNNVTFSGSGSRDLPNNNLLVYGSVNINGPTLNNAFDIDIEIRKDFIMTSGKFIARVNSGNPIIKMGGANVQSITGNFTATNNSDLYNLEINKSLNSVTLASGVEVLKNLILTSGNIITSSASLLTITNPLSSAVTGGSAVSFVNGPLRKRIDNGDDFIFPVGKGTRYGFLSALSAQSTGANYYWTAEYFNSGYSDITTTPPTFSKSSTEYWKLNSPVNGYTSKVRLRWDPQSDITPATTTIADMRVAEYNGADWAEKVSDAPIGDNNNGTIQTTAVISINAATDPQYYTIGSISTVKPTITLSTNPQVCTGTLTANLPYSATTGSPNQYTIDYNAASNAAGFVDVPWSALPASPIVLTVPGAAINGTYNATIQVRASATPGNISVLVSFTVTLNPSPNAITGTTSVCKGSSTTLSDSTPGGTWSSASPAIATISATGLVTGISAGTSLISYTVGNCAATTTLTVVSMNWTGAVNTDWNNPGNWACGFVPDSNTPVQILNVANKPVLSSGSVGHVNNISIDPGSSFTVSGNTIQISGSITNNGTFDASNGTVEMNGSIMQNIGANIFAGNTIKNLIINNSAGVTLQGPFNVSGILTAQNGNLSSGGNLTLLSTAAQTALINGSGSGSVTGNVTMQRYLPSGFGYKYFSSPFQAATVNEFSDDMTLGSFTFYRYDENRTASGWLNYNAPANILYPLEGYAVNFGSNPAAKTVDVTGIVNNGNISVTLYNHNNTYTQGFNLVGNPYPSPIDWDASSGWTKTNIDNAIYLFKASATDQYGGTYSSYVNGVPSGSNLNIIPSMQGFFVHVSNGTFPVTGILSMTNSVRITDVTHPFTKKGLNTVQLLRLAVKFSDDTASVDPLVVYFNETAMPEFDGQLDALKLMNTDLNVPNLYSVTPDGIKLSISALPLITDDFCSVPLGLKLNREGNGTIIFRILNIDESLSGMRIYLTDTVAGIEQDLLPDKAYSVSLEKGEYLNRFFLNLSVSPTDVKPDIRELDDLFSIYSSHGVLKADIKKLDGNEGRLVIYNLTGQVLFIKEIFDTGYFEFNPGIKDGIYITSYTTGTKRSSKKISIQSQ